MIRWAGVNYILDTVFDMLKENKDWTFTWAEIAFFDKWWREQTEESKLEFKALVQNGQFEFVHGGWSLNDEAVCHYEDIITNMMKGHDFLKNEFEIIPEIAWHLD